ncbi:thiol reductant ABC exporter subunit CydD [Phytoactinopolyspora halotolerans]|uniref:Thiol reductant ABC exporter subunit CydD n=1 Tax=Phytoactinopolyspora halotolerans TaxID=1981512 RepID=A0A6L9SBN4_9ACTN|nr:thiol reductant ABC exporter subunit CydD [Phytoactinopolyspora halotolerans]NEE02537.1 thiol reductant ABC exporter subunit CydD [Phytoactinopolyspora halotolerans]
MGFVVLAVVLAALIIGQAEVLAGLLADAVLEQPSPSELAGPLLAFGAILAARAAVAWAQQVLAHRAAASVKASLRRQTQHHVQRLGPGWVGGQHTGGLATTLGRGLDALDPYFTGYFPQLFTTAVVPLAVLVYVATADLASALIICVTLPLIPIFGILVGLQTKKATDRQWKALERLGGRFLDLVAGLPTLRAFGRAKAQALAVRRSAEEHRSATMATLRIAFLSALVLELVATLSVALIAVPVGLRLLDGDLGLHTALLILLLAPEAYLPLRVLGSQFHASTEGLAVAERVFAVLDEDPPEPAASALPDARAATASTAPGLRAGVGRIELVDVTVRYPGRDTPALDRVSLSVRSGERVALVGPSGAGKSTFLSVVLGLVRPDVGRMLVSFGARSGTADDMVDLGDINLAEWRRHVGWVPQRPHLFARTVADNIRLGRPDADDDEVRRAAELAHADEFIDRLPWRFDTELGERGVGLSAGQRQRIALARAFLRDAPLLVLDEPTAGLDAASESVVIEATARLMAGRTVLVVAHRPAVVADADRVIRLERGRLAGDEPPDPDPDQGTATTPIAGVS